MPFSKTNRGPRPHHQEPPNSAKGRIAVPLLHPGRSTAMNQPDLFVCPDCHFPLPEKYRLLAEVICPACGQQKCFTGVCVLGVSAPGLPPAIVQLTSPYWLPIPPVSPEPKPASKGIPDSDESAYIPAKECRNRRIKTHKQLKALLAQEPSIQRRYRGQHLYIHAGDWHRWNAEKDKQAWEALDETNADMEHTKAEIRKEKAAKVSRKRTKSSRPSPLPILGNRMKGGASNGS